MTVFHSRAGEMSNLQQWKASTEVLKWPLGIWRDLTKRRCGGILGVQGRVCMMGNPNYNLYVLAMAAASAYRSPSMSRP
jgi:hypothetical protein